jgi:pimeloyl-ACP methyl ester carboxylesterase
MRYISWNSQPLSECAAKYAHGDFIDLQGRSTHYIESGAGSPIILLHGFFYDTQMWQKNIEALAAHFKVYALDLWGFGYSTREPLDYGYALYAHQLLQFMDALHIETASLIGQSMGGGTIVKFALSHRDRVRKVILVAPAGMPNPLPPMARIANLPPIGEFMYGFPSDFFRRLALKRLFIHNPAHISDSYFENVTRFHKVEGSSEAMLATLRKRYFDTLLPDIRAYGESSLPTLLVWGREDRSTPVELGIEMNALLGNSRLEIIDGAGHCPHDEQAELFNRMAIDFLADADVAA